MIRFRLLMRPFHCKILAVFSLLLVFYYIFYIRNSSVASYGYVKNLRQKILTLSKTYVHELAERSMLIEDGPAAYPDTAYGPKIINLLKSKYDMKKALAVLIDDLNSRVEHLNDRLSVMERLISSVSRSSMKEEVIPPRHVRTIYNNSHVSVIDLLQSKQDTCPFPSFDNWPHCQSKIEWMREMWESDKCYASWGVDGSDCSIYIYLSEQEKWCPPFPWRANKTLSKNYALADVRSDFHNLLHAMSVSPAYEWMRLRVQRMASRWISGGKSLKEKYPEDTRVQKQVLFLMGLLSEKMGFHFAETAFTGGPLGELVQWSDLISAVYTLGHDVKLIHSVEDLKSIYDPVLRSSSQNCPLKDKPFDIIYTDITGLKMLKKIANSKLHLFQCLVRVLDSFGTEPEFNHANYASGKHHKSHWGNWKLNPKQFNTMFPHSPDNTFLGFVVEEHWNETAQKDIAKENFALVYGKRDKFWEGKESYIAAFENLVEVHATVDQTVPPKHVPSFVINHGVLSGPDLHKLLRKTKIFIGLGFPYEGPAPLEAIANGAVFLNPVFDPPKDRENTPFFKDKPTLRKLTSQHPYAEMYIGYPYVQPVSFTDFVQLESIVKKILNGQNLPPYLPYEFTCGGMLERLSLHLEKQEFCSGSYTPEWPPASALQTLITDTKESCVDACYKNGLVCEPQYFSLLNSQSAFLELGINCTRFVPTVPITEIDYPAYLNDVCFLQSDPLLFSCAGRYTSMHRLCPCRDYMKGQIALCKDCF